MRKCARGRGGACVPDFRASGARRHPAAPAAERRLVSVLFADLVGFTTLSESRDAEEVRELLSRYFDTCRRLIELYGGTVEKFIGDAVMAVWGTPDCDRGRRGARRAGGASTSSQRCPRSGRRSAPRSSARGQASSRVRPR